VKGSYAASIKNSAEDTQEEVKVDMNFKIYEGWLIKHVRKIKFLQRTRFPKRYFILN